MDLSRSNTPLHAANAANPVSAHFDELKRDISGFFTVFNQWIDERRRTLTDDKEMYLKTLAEERDTVEALKRQHQQLVAKKQQVSQAIDLEQKELKEAQLANQELSQQTIQLQQKADELKTEFQKLQLEVDKETKVVGSWEKSREQEVTDKKTLISLYEDVMGVRIEPISDDRIKLVLTKIDPVQPLRPSSVTIDHSGDRYSVVECSPTIPDMPSIVAALNQTHDFCQFVCRVRRRFLELTGSGK